MDGHAGHRVLVVEDDAELRDKVLVPSLRGYGFDAAGVGSFAAMRQAMAERDFALVVLDVMLPDADGFTVAAQLRAGSPVGIVMLTVLDSLADQVRGLRQGADIYLSKPIDMELLAASLHSLVRRMASLSPASSPSPGWRLEASGWRLLAPDDTVIALSLPERILLQRLSASPDRPVPREALVDALAEHLEDFDPSRLEMLVHRLRRKVVARTDSELPLVAVRRVGYLLSMDRAM